jgi:hypothetical protein
VTGRDSGSKLVMKGSPVRVRASAFSIQAELTAPAISSQKRARTFGERFPCFADQIRGGRSSCAARSPGRGRRSAGDPRARAPSLRPTYSPRNSETEPPWVSPAIRSPPSLTGASRSSRWYGPQLTGIHDHVTRLVRARRETQSPLASVSSARIGRGGGAVAGACRRPGTPRLASAPTRDRPAATPSAGANPSLKACAEA